MRLAVAGATALSLGRLGAITTSAAHAAPEAQSMHGLWVAFWRPRTAPPGRVGPGLVTQFDAGGGVHVSLLPTFVGAQDVRGYQTDGLGEWLAQDDGAFAFGYVVSFADDKGQFTSRLSVRATVQLNETGDDFQGEFLRQDTDANGNVVLSREGFVEGSRIRPANSVLAHS